MRETDKTSKAHRDTCPKEGWEATREAPRQASSIGSDAFLTERPVPAATQGLRLALGLRASCFVFRVSDSGFRVLRGGLREEGGGRRCEVLREERSACGDDCLEFFLNSLPQAGYVGAPPADEDVLCHRLRLCVCVCVE